MNTLTYNVIADTIDHLIIHTPQASDLQTLAARAGYETTYFQKLFHEYVGVTPKQFERFLSLTKAREFLLSGYSTLEAAYAAGLSGNGRLHDACIQIEAASPAEVRSGGKGIRISYGWHDMPFGSCLIAETDKGVCWIGFALDYRTQTEDLLRQRWPHAQFHEDEVRTAHTAGRILEVWRGRAYTGKIKLNLYGTNFQLQVWQALLKIPSGSTVSYQTIAKELGNPKASRAVGSAVGANPVSLFIPCHRVIQKSGVVENYAWGSARKRVLLGLEGLTNPDNPAWNKDQAADGQAI